MQIVLLTAKTAANAGLYEEASAGMNKTLEPFNVRHMPDFYLCVDGNGIKREMWRYELLGVDSLGAIDPRLYLDTNPGGCLELRVFVWERPELLQNGLIGRLEKAFKGLTGLSLKVDGGALQPTIVKPQQESRGMTYATQ